MNANRERVVGYVRVSSEGQTEHGVSLEAQRGKLRAYATAMDLELVTIVADAGLSAKSLARPGLQAALTLLETDEADGILVAKLDRLTRSVRDLGDLVDRYFSKRYSLLSVGDSVDTRTAGGRLVLHVLASVSQWEREAAAERTREALAHVKRDGGRIGREGLGWRRLRERDESGRCLIAAIDAEQATIARIVELRRAGASLPAITRQLAAEGRATKRGGSWHPESIRRLLARTPSAVCARQPP